MTAGALRVVVSHERNRDAATAGLSRWLARVAPSRARGLVHVAVTSDARVRALNRRYRRRDRATDVLSFRYAPQGIGRRLSSARRIENSQFPIVDFCGAPQPCLGDIVIARGMARRQARTAGHDERTELRVLALHGLLHVLGYDHHRDGGLMARTEQRLRRKGGLREGLIERSQP